MLFTTVCNRHFKIVNGTLNCVQFEYSSGSFMLSGQQNCTNLTGTQHAYILLLMA